MSIFERMFKPKPNVPTLEEERAAMTKEQEEADAAIERGRKVGRALIEEERKNKETTPEQRLAEVNFEIKNLHGVLDAIDKQGQMQKILDREANLNNIVRPPFMNQDEFSRSIERDRMPIAQEKRNLEKTVDEHRQWIRELENEKSEIEKRIQRGY